MASFLKHNQSLVDHSQLLRVFYPSNHGSQLEEPASAQDGVWIPSATTPRIREIWGADVGWLKAVWCFNPAGQSACDVIIPQRRRAFEQSSGPGAMPCRCLRIAARHLVVRR